MFLRNSEFQNLTSNKVDSVFIYIDEHANHKHVHATGGGAGNGNQKEIEQENILFHDINQTVIKLSSATIHFSQNITCKLIIFNIYSQELIQSIDSTKRLFIPISKFSL